MSSRNELVDSLESFLDEGWISEVLFEVKSGKEATVFCCRGGPRVCNAALMAAKVYRPIETRRFKNDAIYQIGRMHLARPSRAQRAAENKSAFGRKIQYATWMDNEWETMRLLHSAGADVPGPLARNEQAMLMPFVGDERGGAIKLAESDLSQSTAERITDRLLWNIELMLDCDRVHGDLSPYNVLLWMDAAVLIDFPQAIDPRLNPAALQLLSRDIEQVCRWASRHGVRRQAHAITMRLWNSFVLGEIG